MAKEIYKDEILKILQNSDLFEPEELTLLLEKNPDTEEYWKVMKQVWDRGNKLGVEESDFMVKKCINPEYGFDILMWNNFKDNKLK